MSNDSCQNEKGFIGGLVLGGLLGASIVFLFGTDKGKKVQKEIKEKGLELQKKAVENVEELMDELEEKGLELEKKAVEVKKQIEVKLEDTRENLTEELGNRLDSTLSHIEALQDRGREATASIHKSLKDKNYFKNIPKKT